MDKLFIQQMLRESLEAKIQEAEKDDKEGNKSFDELNKDEKMLISATIYPIILYNFALFLNNFFTQ